jgi:BioD-like phosphotransacetylase family protein
MLSIFIGSTGNHPGQTLLAWAVAEKLKEKGLRVGFFKPYGLLPSSAVSSREIVCDGDVFLLKEVLNLSEEVQTLCPVMMPENPPGEFSGSLPEDLLQRIDRAFQESSRGKDVVLILGAKEIFFGGEMSPLSDSMLVKRLNANVLLADRYQRDNLTFYSILSLNSFLEGRVKAAVLNYVPPEKMDHVQSRVIPFLREKGLRFAGAVPEDSLLSAFTVADLAEWTDGEILCCPEKAGELIVSFTIGSKILEGPLALFKQVYNKILLVRLGDGERSGVGGILLTGGKPPSDLILRKAAEQALPLILVSTDTFQTMERLEKARPSLSLRDDYKVRRFLWLLDQDPQAKNWVESLL